MAANDAEDIMAGVAGELKAGVAELRAGVSELKAGVAELNAGVSDLKAGVAELKAGAESKESMAGSVQGAMAINPVCRDFVEDTAYQEPIHELGKILRRSMPPRGRPVWR